jgi:hypothetical protein
MPTCEKCGAAVDDLATVCPSCGAQIETRPEALDAPISSDKTLPTEPDSEEHNGKKPTPPPSPSGFSLLKRPGAVTITIALLILGGVLLLAFSSPYTLYMAKGGVTVTATVTSAATMVSSAATTTVTSSTNSTSVTVVTISSNELALYSIPYIIGGIISLVAAYGFLVRTRWAFRLSVVAAIFGIVQVFLLSIIYCLLIGVAILYFQTRPQVRAWLRKEGMGPPSSIPRQKESQVSPPKR